MKKYTKFKNITLNDLDNLIYELKLGKNENIEWHEKLLRFCEINHKRTKTNFNIKNDFRLLLVNFFVEHYKKFRDVRYLNIALKIKPKIYAFDVTIKNLIKSI